MNWKLFTIVCINSSLLLFPYNIIGCSGGDADPYDYFVSFFHNKVSGNTDYEPFYYTNVQFLYQSEEPINVAEVTSAEWTGFGGNSYSAKDAYGFVCRFSHKDLSSLYQYLEKNQPLKIPDSVSNNGMTKFFLREKNLEALGYILYAKQSEPYVTGNWNEWEPIQRDSVKMDKLIKNGRQLLNASKNNFIKLRYAYQLVRLARYSGRNQDCVKWYDEWIKPNNTESVLQDLSLSLKAGAQLYTGKRELAAYNFSQLFAKSNLKKISNYMSFSWCVDRFDPESRKKALQICKTNTEKANMLGLFALGSNQNEMNTLMEISRLAPQSPVLPVLVTREINKLEEFYFTPASQPNNGKEKLHITSKESGSNDNVTKSWEQECLQLADYCKKIAAADNKNKSFYLLAGAHTAMIAGNNMNSRALLDQIKKETLSPLQADQWYLTNLLVAINSEKTITPEFEKKLMPSVEWLEKKARADNEFAKFYRRLFADILSVKYGNATDKNNIKYILCNGVADQINKDYVKESWGYYPQALYRLRKEVPAKQVEELIQLLESKNLNPFEKFIVSNCSFRKEDVYDLAGTAWLRQYNFNEAEKWFKKVPAAYYSGEPYKTYLAANPFADLLLDTHAPTKQDTVVYTKLSFSQKMIRLQKELTATNDKEKKALLHYELAKGYYHMSYWGNSWLLAQYGWSGSEYEYENTSENFTTRYNPDYFEANRAKENYLNALANTTNKNLQAKCIFMAAKCDQKQVGNLPGENSGTSEWLRNFDKRNAFFSRLSKDFTGTAFYKEAFNTCSYLRDFVQKK